MLRSSGYPVLSYDSNSEQCVELNCFIECLNDVLLTSVRHLITSLFTDEEQIL